MHNQRSNNQGNISNFHFRVIGMYSIANPQPTQYKLELGGTHLRTMNKGPRTKNQWLI